MKKIIAILSVLTTLAISSSVYADGEITIKYNGTALAFSESPVIMNDKTLVQLRPIAEAMHLQIGFSELDGSVVLSNDNTTVIFKKDLNRKLVNGVEIQMDVPMILKNDYTFVPVRDLVEPFGENIGYDDKTRTVTIVTDDKSSSEKGNDDKNTNDIAPKPTPLEEERPKKPQPENDAKEVAEKKVISTGSGKYDYTYFTQSQPDMELENEGRGYCWVCSYAMVMSEALEKVITPLDVAQYNIDAGFSGNYIAGHETLLAQYGLKFAQAISEDSELFVEFKKGFRGETVIMAETDEQVITALKMALDKFPSGIIVRFDCFPHSMVAVGYEGDTIYFNDPGIKNGEHVTFEKSCLKNYKLTDISYIQAIEAQDECL